MRGAVIAGLLLVAAMAFGDGSVVIRGSGLFSRKTTSPEYPYSETILRWMCETNAGPVHDSSVLGTSTGESTLIVYNGLYNTPGLTGTNGVQNVFNAYSNGVDHRIQFGTSVLGTYTTMTVTALVFPQNSVYSMPLCSFSQGTSTSNYFVFGMDVQTNIQLRIEERNNRATVSSVTTKGPATKCPASTFSYVAARWRGTQYELISNARTQATMKVGSPTGRGVGAFTGLTHAMFGHARIGNAYAWQGGDGNFSFIRPTIYKTYLSDAHLRTNFVAEVFAAGLCSPFWTNQARVATFCDHVDINISCFTYPGSGAGSGSVSKRLLAGGGNAAVVIQTPSTARMPNGNDVMDFNGSSHSWTDTTYLDTVGTSIVWMAWLKIDITNSTSRWIFEKVNTAASDIFRCYSAVAGFTFETKQNGATTDYLTYKPTSAYVGSWHHLACLWNTMRGKEIFWDGVRVATDAAETTLMKSDNDYDFAIGRSLVTSSWYDGMGDDFVCSSTWCPSTNDILLYVRATTNIYGVCP